MQGPINVWFADGVRHEDYRTDDGRIVTVEVPVHVQCRGCGGVESADHDCKRRR